jgi:phage terminase small subunit
VIDFNGRRAAIAAGYGEARAEVTASELLKVPRVTALIDELRSQRATKLGLKAEQVLEELQFARVSLSASPQAQVQGFAGWGGEFPLGTDNLVRHY